MPAEQTPPLSSTRSDGAEVLQCLAHAVQLTCLVLLPLAAVLFTWRRVRHGYAEPLSWRSIALWAGSVVTLTLIAICPETASPKRTSSPWRRLLLEAAIVLCAATLCFPGMGWVKGLSICAFAVAVAAGVHFSPELAAYCPCCATDAVRPDFPTFAQSPPPDENVISTLTRLRQADGSEQIIAQLKISFAPGEKRATAYVPFCPPLDPVPTCSADVLELIQLDGVADVEVAQAGASGARVEVSLTPAAATNGAVLVSFVAPAPPAEQE